MTGQQPNDTATRSESGECLSQLGAVVPSISHQVGPFATRAVRCCDTDDSRVILFLDHSWSQRATDH